MMKRLVAGVLLAGTVAARGPEPTPKARAQLEQVRRAAAAFPTPEAARAAGYEPVFGHVPLQGEHFVRTDLVAGDRFDPRHPPVLIYAPVDGRPALVGAAYAYLRPASAPAPEGFDGPEDVWHTHDDLVRVPGRRLYMTHVWLGESPDGVFAHYNAAIPFRAAGLAAPARAHDAVSVRRVRQLARALALATMPPREVEWAERTPSVRTAAEPHRAAIRALLPRLRAAQRSGDTALFDGLSADAVRHADALIAALRSGAPSRGLDRALEEFFAAGDGHPHG
jgi:hypothetical protein